VRDCKVNYTIR